MSRMVGTIKNLVTPPGKTAPTFGFITGMEDGVDRFFIPESLAPNSSIGWSKLSPRMTVDFEPVLVERGHRAKEVRVVADGHASEGRALLGGRTRDT